MKKALFVVKNILTAAVGFFTVPLFILGFLLATNSAKGFGTYDPDGMLFIPLGIVVLAALIAFLVLRIVKLAKAKMPEKKKEIICYGCYAAGLAVYMIYWICIYPVVG